MSVKGGCLGIVLLRYGKRIVPIGLGFEEYSGVCVSTDFHFFEFEVFPLVHRYGTDEGQVYAEASVLSGTLKTYPYAIRYRNPLGIVSTTLEAFLGDEKS